MTAQIMGKSVPIRTRYIVLLLAVLAGQLIGAAPASAQSDSIASSIARIEKRYEQLFAAAKYAAALAQARDLTALTRSRLGARDPEHVAALEKLSLAYAALGRDERAVAAAEQAIDIARSRNAAIGSELADMLVRLANRHDSSSRQHEAKGAYSNALTVKLELLKRQPRANELKVASAATELAAALTEDGDLAQAVELHAFALAIRERRLGANDLPVAENLHGLAGLAVKQDHREEAEGFYHRVLAIRVAKLGPTHGDVADILEELADALSNGRSAEAEALRARALVIRRTDSPMFIRGPRLRLSPRPVPPVPVQAPC
jgi:tetratricopeptide (TPR) repeat protein